jgi:hypothetical protein
MLSRDGLGVDRKGPYAKNQFRLIQGPDFNPYLHQTSQFAQRDTSSQAAATGVYLPYLSHFRPYIKRTIEPNINVLCSTLPSLSRIHMAMTW